jgi:hypothetical protein
MEHSALLILTFSLFITACDNKAADKKLHDECIKIRQQNFQNNFSDPTREEIEKCAKIWADLYK